MITTLCSHERLSLVIISIEYTDDWHLVKPSTGVLQSNFSNFTRKLRPPVGPESAGLKNNFRSNLADKSQCRFLIISILVNPFALPTTRRFRLSYFYARMDKIIMRAKYAPRFLLSGLTADICIFRNVPGFLGRVWERALQSCDPRYILKVFQRF